MQMDRPFVILPIITWILFKKLLFPLPCLVWGSFASVSAAVRALCLLSRPSFPLTWHFRNVNYLPSSPRCGIGNHRCVFLSPPSGRKDEFFCPALLKSSVQLKFLFSVLFFFFFSPRFCFVFTKYWFIERCVTLNWHIDISRNCGYCFEKYNPTLTDSYHYLEPLLRVSETSLINNESESYWGEQPWETAEFAVLTPGNFGAAMTSRGVNGMQGRWNPATWW